MKTLCKTIFFLILIFYFSSCNKSNAETKISKSINENSLKESEIELTDLETDDYSFPVDTLLEANVLWTEVFHDDEVNQDLEKKTWFGLFKNKNDYSFSKTKISINRAYDPIVDEDESTQTGWEVRAKIKDTCVILIEKLPGFVNRNVQFIKTPESVYPQESFKFQFLGTDYKLFATGEKKKESPDSDWFVVSNYKLYLSAYDNGNEVTELLVSRKSFDEQMVKIIFAGDIDGDSKLDLIIDTASHYNVSSPTIYLSKSAEKEGKIIKPIGVFTYVGC